MNSSRPTQAGRVGFRAGVAVGLLLLGTLRGAVIPGLFNTGVGADGRLLAGGAADPHYRLIQSADPSYPGPVARVVQEGYPIPPWAANGPKSKWVAPRANQTSGNAAGDYIYRLTFDLTGLAPETAVIRGTWSSDNLGSDIRLNGASTGFANDGNFTVLGRSFTLSTGFVEGTNTLDFVVNNAGGEINPTGLRVELEGTAEPRAPDAPPVIIRPPASVVANLRDPATFSVLATGTPPLVYQWSHDLVAVPGATSATLSIPSVGPADEGLYTVTVRNPYGATQSPPARLDLVFRRPDQPAPEPPGPSSRRTGVVFTEIMYHPAARADGLNLEFIELYNSNPFFEDLGGWRIAGDWDYTFPPGTRIEGNGFLVVAAAPAALETVYGLTGVLGGFDRNLPNDGGTVRLRKRSNAVVLEVEYTDEPPWPVAADGTGHSLVLVRPSLGEADPRAWSASAWFGGSPGRHDALRELNRDTVVINEVLSGSTSDYLELLNPGLRSVDLSGAVLTDDARVPRFVFPPGTRVDPGAFLTLNAAQLGFSLDSRRKALVLIDAGATYTLDALRADGQAPGLAYGRHPDGAPRFRRLETPTPGQSNARPLRPTVHFSELLFHPLSGDDRDEFIELHNRGAQAVDLGGWRLSGGVRFTFPPETMIAAGGYLVVAGQADRFRTNHPSLDPARVTGDFAGNLSDRGERVVLGYPDVARPANLAAGDAAEPWLTVVDEVSYGDGGQWGRWADGGGSSLERVDPRADPDLGPTWADSDESAKAPWTLIEQTGVLDLGHPAVPAADQLQVMLLGAGEALVDNVEVLVQGANRIRNPTLESGVANWTFQGTHRTSRWEPTEGYQSRGSLRVIASERGDHVANRIRTSLSTTIPLGTTATIRARVRWLRGHPEILLRLRNGALEASGRLATPNNPGTPGAPNSRSRANAGPAITAVQHQPTLPGAGQPIRVTAWLDDPDGLSSVALVYRRDPVSTVSSVPMVDDGTGGDLVAGDAVYTGTMPGQTAQTLLAFHVEATDAATPTAAARFPAGPTGAECLVRVGDPTPTGAFGVYRLWIAQANHDAWARREQMSNEDVDVTFVYGAHRAIYHAGARYSGSSYSAPGYNSPTGNPCGYDLHFPKDERLLGATHFILDWPVRDDTNQREQLMFWMLDQFDLPNLYRRYVHLFVNGQRRSTLYDDAQQPGDDTVAEWFADDPDGTLWKTDCWNEFDNAGNRLDPCILNTLERFRARDGSLKVARYRWNWRPRAVRGSANDFTDLFELVEAVNASSNYLAAVEAVVDVDHWMRTFVMNDLASFWDAFGNGNAKNTFLYKPRYDTWKLMCWDFDVGLGVFYDPPDAALFDVNDPTVRRLYQTPAFVRRYWAALAEALDTFFEGTATDPILDAKYAAFQAHGVSVNSPAAIKSWIAARRAYLLAQLRTVQAPFAITSNGGRDFATAQNPVTLSGTAPVAAVTLAVNGVPHPLRWSTITNWSVSIHLDPGLNALTLEGWNRQSAPVPQARDSIQVTYTGRPPPPAVRLNEWMAANRSGLADPADGDYDDWFELFNPADTPVSLGGFTLTDDPGEPTRFVIPPGFTLPPRGFLLVWADGEPDQTRPGESLHTNFRLDRDGDSLSLYAADGSLVDTLRFGPQRDDSSQGRWPDGAGEPFFDMVPSTPAAPNRPDPAAGPGPRILAAEFVPERGFSVRWTSLPQRKYALRYRETLGTGAWADVPGQITAEGATAGAIDATAGADRQRYYQVIVITE